jgi:cell division protein FtsB
LNQKLQQLTEENEKFRKNIEKLKKQGAVPEEESSKPFLFGPEEAD